MVIRMLAALCLVTVAGCEPVSSEKSLFEEGRSLGVNENRNLEEASGLAASRVHPGLFWAHNDSGHPPELFLLDSTGQTVVSFQVLGARNRDWEDIAIGPGPDSVSTIFIGDIGDNQQRHPLRRIYCVKEPNPGDSTSLLAADTLIFRLSDKPRDAEALMFDPLTRNLYVVSKLEHEVHVYEIGYPYPADTFAVASNLKLPVRHITAGDISYDGTEILLKNYTTIYYWRRSPGQTVLEALQQEPIELPYEQEPQGESIAWSTDGSGFYTMSENGKGQRGHMIFYARRSEADTAKSQP